MQLSSEVEKLIDNTVATHVYYNVSIRNTSESEAIATFSETLSMPLLEDCGKYYMSLVRFNIPTDYIPIMIFPVMPYPNTDPDKSIYSVTLSYNGVDSQVYLQWTPERASSTALTGRRLLSATAPSQQAVEYYYMYSYQHFIDILNKALSDALAGLVGAPNSVQAPFALIDMASSLITVNAQSDYFDSNVDGGIKLYFNADLHNLLDNFQFIHHGDGQVNGKDYELMIKNNGRNIMNSTSVMPPNTHVENVWYSMTQEYPNLSDFNSFAGLVIKTGSIPIRTESVPVAQKFGTAVQAVSSSANYEPIITDFDIASEKGWENRSVVMYYTQSEYRMIDVLGKGQELKNMSFSIYWRDSYGNLYPLKIGRNSTASLKILFRHKMFNL